MCGHGYLLPSLLFLLYIYLWGITFGVAFNAVMLYSKLKHWRIARQGFGLMKKLVRDQRSQIMSAIKSKGSKIEETLSKALWKRGYRYRRNYRRVYGTPDIVFTKYKLAIFCDSEFWHGKDWGKRDWRIRSNREFWVKKIENNIDRDLAVNETLKEKGYVVLRFWGEEIMKNTDACVEKIISTLNRLKAKNSKEKNLDEKKV